MMHYVRVMAAHRTPPTKPARGAGVVLELGDADLLALARLQRLDDWHWVRSVFEATLPFAAAAGLLPESLPVSVRLAVAAVGAGATARGLARLVHEVSHGTLAKDFVLAHRVGRVAGAVVFQSVDRYGRSHGPHHGKPGDVDRDGEFADLAAEGMYRPTSRRWFQRTALVAPLFGARTVRYWRYIFRHRTTPRSAVAGLALNLGVVVAVALMAGWAMSAAWIVGLVFVYPALGWLIELSEHFPMAGFVKTASATRHRACGPLSRWLVGLIDERFHLAHHTLPKVPHWNLRAAHRILLRDPGYRAAVEAQGSVRWRPLGFVRQLVGLYDQWVELSAGVTPPAPKPSSASPRRPSTTGPGSIRPAGTRPGHRGPGRRDRSLTPGRGASRARATRP